MTSRVPSPSSNRVTPLPCAPANVPSEKQQALLRKTEIQREINLCVKLLDQSTPKTIDSVCHKISRILPYASELRRLQTGDLSEDDQRNIRELLTQLEYFDKLSKAYQDYKISLDTQKRQLESLASFPPPLETVVESTPPLHPFLMYFANLHPLQQFQKEIQEASRSVFYCAMEFYSLQDAVKDISWNRTTLAEMNNLTKRVEYLGKFRNVFFQHAPKLYNILNRALEDLNDQLIPLQNESRDLEMERKFLKRLLQRAKANPTNNTHTLSLNFFDTSKPKNSNYQRLQSLIIHRWTTAKQISSRIALYEALFPVSLRHANELLEKCAEWWKKKQPLELSVQERAKICEWAEDRTLPVALQIQFHLILQILGSKEHPGHVKEWFNPLKKLPQWFYDWLHCKIIMLQVLHPDEREKASPPANVRFFTILNKLREFQLPLDARPFLHNIKIYTEELKSEEVKKEIYVPFNQLIAFKLGALKNFEPYRKHCTTLLKNMNKSIAMDSNTHLSEVIIVLMHTRIHLQSLVHAIQNAKPLSQLNNKLLQYILEHLWLINALLQKPLLFSKAYLPITVQFSSTLICAATITLYKIFLGYGTTPLAELGLPPENIDPVTTHEILNEFLHQIEITDDFERYRVSSFEAYQRIIRQSLERNRLLANMILERDWL